MGVFQNKKTGNWKAEIWSKGRKVSSKTFTKKILAEKYFKEKSLEAENQLVTGSIAKDYTYDECYKFWQENAISRLSQRTQIKNKQLNQNYISPIIGKLKISEITIFQFELIVSSLVRKDLSKAGLHG